MATNVKRNNAPNQPTIPKVMRVMPNVTDPAMKSNKTTGEHLLSEMGESEMEDVVFNNSRKTKEEQLAAANPSGAPTTDNTILIVIFALIVIALIAIIVWMIVKQGGDKKEEEDIKRRLRQPNPRSNMPPLNRYAVRAGAEGLTDEERHQQMMHQQYMMHQSQQRERMQHANPSQSASGGDAFTVALGVQQANDIKQSSEKNDNQSNNQTRNQLHNQTSSQDNDEDADTTFTKDNPHPNIIRPKSDPSESNTTMSDVDDIMKKAQSALNGKSKNSTDQPQKNTSNNTLTSSDKALLDQLSSKDPVDEEESEDGMSDDE